MKYHVGQSFRVTVREDVVAYKRIHIEDIADDILYLKCEMTNGYKIK